MDYKGKILIGTVMLEKNRWTLEKVPTVRITDWLGMFAKDDFEGIELWENHVLRNPESELMKIKSCGLPLIYLSSYLKFDGSDNEEMQKVAEVAKELSAASIKFNFSNNIDLLETHIVKIRRFAELLPEDCSLLCECHANTIMADLNNAFKVFEILNDERFGIIIHLFDPLEILQKWFMAFGQKIKHVHIHLYDGGNIIALRNKPELLVNTARGALIDEEALIDELRIGRISAVLDVYEKEPLPFDSPLR